MPNAASKIFPIIVTTDPVAKALHRIVARGRSGRVVNGRAVYRRRYLRDEYEDTNDRTAKR